MKRVIIGAAGIVALGIIASPAFAQDPKLQLGLPGIPPVFGTVLQYTAQDAGLFKKYGVDVTLRPFDSGAAAARAVQSGNIDISLSPTPVVVNMIANAGVNMATIWGMENPDWLISTTDPAIKKCADVKGQVMNQGRKEGESALQAQQLASDPEAYSSFWAVQAHAKRLHA